MVYYIINYDVTGLYLKKANMLYITDTDKSGYADIPKPNV